MKCGRSGQVIVLVAIAGMVIAAAGSGTAVEGYSHWRHPLAWLGAVQLGTAGTLFGVFGFLLPGLAAAWIAWGLRAALPAGSGWIAGIGAQLALLAALAFAAQGLLPLDLENADGGAGRGHAAAWLGWALAFPLGALALAAGLRGSNGGRRLAGWSLLAGALVLAGCFLAGGWIGAALAQRLAIAAWLGWNLAAPRALSRGAT